MHNDRVFIMCPGVGHIGRGYETFSIELHEELRKIGLSETYLIKGAGTSTSTEKAVWCLKRTSKFTQRLARLLKVPPYALEQLTFFLSSLPLLGLKRPKVIIYSDFMLGVWLWYLRKFLHLNYQLLFSNGAPNGPPFTRCDFVQQLLPFYKEQALAAGEDPSRHFVLPYAIHVPSLPKAEFLERRKRAKEQLGFGQQLVILCVAAINDSHKRISYLLEEAKDWGREDLFILLIGQKSEESESIIAKGNMLFGNRLIAKTVGKEELETYYFAADIFVLPSLTEGLPRVMLEATSYGLPVLSHDYEVSRNVMGTMGYYGDFTKKGSLSSLLQNNSVLPESMSAETLIHRRDYVRNLYSWEVLAPHYLHMIEKVAHFSPTSKE